MSFAIRAGLLFGAAAVATVVCADEARWKVVQGQISKEFPRVTPITTKELATLLAKTDSGKPVLLDVRTRAEYDVSHLQGAHHVEPGSEVANLRPQLPKNAPIVTYCAVGYRSAQFAEKLRNAGFTDVRNLDGSIFRWANEDRPLVRDGQPADTVHPYNRFWGGLVKEERRARVPSVK